MICVNIFHLVMQQNIELSLQNVVKLEEIQDRTEDLSKQASVFKKHGSQLRKNMYWRNIKVSFHLPNLISNSIRAETSKVICGCSSFFV